ncbi:MAG: hypothetical protein I3273_02790 [Candidatus Moeniiplasma glomeromycotorum]|nr:hypothetical protein [Candidatus Moeniiplasma glomeromycotorum]MCE8167618.1 hypothetical protein [Candidatus Moeniiplasma glomeromycotorum]MCE8169032.1 hypothetical protein [Candidatus Moeniiplasma glomeromycotorum]
MSKKTCHHCYKKFEEEDMIKCCCNFSCVECHKKQKQQQQEQQSKCSLVLNAGFPYFLVSIIALVIIILACLYKKSWKWYNKKLFEKEKN